MKPIHCRMLILYLFGFICHDYVTAIGRVDITIDKLRLSNVFYGSTETATLVCKQGYWDDNTNDPFNINNNQEIKTYSGNLVLNGFGAKFISMPKKNYRFNIDNESLVLINAVEPGRVMTSLINILAYNTGGGYIIQKYVELYVNNEYNGLYYTKRMIHYDNSINFKIETDILPQNSDLLLDIDIEHNVDDSYNVFSYLSVLFSIDDMVKHNYVITRSINDNDASNGIFKFTAWDTDLALGAPTKSPLATYNIEGSLSSIFMTNRLLNQDDTILSTATFHSVSSTYNLYKISAPRNITIYKNNFYNSLTTGSLSIENITNLIQIYNNELGDAFVRDDNKWSGYYCQDDNLFSVDYLVNVIGIRHEEVISRITHGYTSNTETPYKYCNYVAQPNVGIIIIASLSILFNGWCRNKLGLFSSIMVLLAYLVFNRFDLANIAPVVGSEYLERNDMVSVILCFVLLSVFSQTNPRNKNIKYFMLGVYTVISFVLSVMGIIETMQLGKLSKTHQAVSSTGKVLVDTSIFDVRRGELMFGIFIYWKLICQLVFAQITLRIPDICDYSPPFYVDNRDLSCTTVNPENFSNDKNKQRKKKRVITRFIKFNIAVFTIALMLLFIIWPPKMKAIEIIIQIVSGLISALVLFNLRGIYVILKYAMLKNYNIAPESFNIIMSNRHHDTWNLKSLLQKELLRIKTESVNLDEELNTSPMAKRFRTADAFPKKLSHIIDGLVVFMLSVQQLGEKDESLLDVLTLSGAIIFIQLFMYGVSYSNNGRLGFIMYGSKARIMDGYLGRENEIFGWICDKYMLPLSFALEKMLGNHLEDELMRPISFMIFMPIIVGDSFGEIVGGTWGKQRIQVWGMGETNKKSYEGTAAVFLSSLICLISAAAYYNLSFVAYVLGFVCSLVSTFVELYAPRSTDNVFMLLANLGCCLLFASSFDLKN